MTIAVTGATGNLGRLTVEALLERGVAPSDIVALVRTPAKAADLAERGVQVRAADYDDKQSYVDALAGVDRLVLVSSSTVGQRLAQHTNVIEAAKHSGVRSIAYTSILDAQDSPLALAAEHKATESVLIESGIPFTLLRNGWYWENYTEGLEQTIEHGVLIGASNDGRIAAAARVDFAEAAAVVASTEGHEGRSYELGGDERLTKAQLADAISAVGGKPVVYRNLSEADFAAALVEVGLPEGFAKILADSDAGAGKGGLDTDSGDLQKLIGRASTPVATVLAAAL